MPLEGLRWSRDSGSALCDTSQNSRSRTGWGVGLSSPFLQTTQRQHYGHKLYQRIQKLCECILQAHKRTDELDNKETRRY